MSEDTELRMSAYYYGFDETGIRVIDEILSAVATAGKCCHHTDAWCDSDEGELSHADKIQMAADRAADYIRKNRRGDVG